jgi:hypothetical protein
MEDAEESDLGTGRTESPGLGLEEIEQQFVFDNYLVPSGQRSPKDGVTLMLHHIPYRFQVEPDIYQLLEDVSCLDSVDYIYLPMTIDGFSRTMAPTRNKGYCFVHFSRSEAAMVFENSIARMSPGEDTLQGTFKSMHVSLAKFQGVSINLTELLDIRSKKWRPKHGAIYIRIGSQLRAINLLALRNHLKAYKRRQDDEMRQAASRSNLYYPEGGGRFPFQRPG